MLWSTNEISKIFFDPALIFQSWMYIFAKLDPKLVVYLHKIHLCKFVWILFLNYFFLYLYFFCTSMFVFLCMYIFQSVYIIWWNCLNIPDENNYSTFLIVFIMLVFFFFQLKVFKWRCNISLNRSSLSKVVSRHTYSSVIPCTLIRLLTESVRSKYFVLDQLTHSGHRLTD